jgi:hypothetical protein
MCFIAIYENRRMKAVEIFVRRGRGENRERLSRITLRYIVSTYVNITVYPSVQLLNANKRVFFK